MCWWLQEFYCVLKSSKSNTTDSISQLTDLSGGREPAKNLLGSSTFLQYHFHLDFSSKDIFSPNKYFVLKASMRATRKF